MMVIALGSSKKETMCDFTEPWPVATWVWDDNVMVLVYPHNRPSLAQAL